MRNKHSCWLSRPSFAQGLVAKCSLPEILSLRGFTELVSPRGLPVQ